MEMRDGIIKVLRRHSSIPNDLRDNITDTILSLFTEELRGAFVAGAAWADGVIEWAGELDYSHATDAAARRYGGKS